MRHQIYEMAYLGIVLIFAAAACAGAQGGAIPSGDILTRCPTLARLIRTVGVNQISNPVFTDKKAAVRFARDCANVVAELDKVVPLPQAYTQLRKDAALAAEFLGGDTYLLATSNVGSVVKLRELVKIPPPPGFVYVRKYASKSSMPPEVAEVFAELADSEGSKVRGVTINGRYIALLETEFHNELVDNLSHELVHSYLMLAARTDLPKWFQEGAAVYFSTGRESGLYFKTGDPRIKEVTIPEDYKRKLYSFQYIEDKAGREKLFAFIRKSVETGRVEPPMALGLGQERRPPRHRLWPMLLIVAGIAAALVITWLIFRRDEGWVD